MDSHILSAPDLPPTGLQPSSGVEPHGHEVGSSPAPETAKAAPQLQDQIPGYEDEPLVQRPAYRTILAPAAKPTVHAPQVQDRILPSEDKPALATPAPAVARPPAPVTWASTPELTMPDEALPDAAPAAVPSIALPQAAQHSTRNVLLGTAGALGLTVLLAGGGFYALTHRGGAMPLADTVAMPQAVRPSEALAANQGDCRRPTRPRRSPPSRQRLAVPAPPRLHPRRTRPMPRTSWA